MTNREALSIFLRGPVSTPMVDYLVVTAESVIRLRQETSYSLKESATTPLKKFIKSLILHSNVQTNTLMSTLYFLVKLRGILPPSATGIHASTHHRVFLGCLILAAKTLNDSSPLNHHWASYTNGLLSLDDVNTLERELLGYFNWDLRIHTNDLLNILAPFLSPIAYSLRKSKNLRITESVPTLALDNESFLRNSGKFNTAYCSVNSIPSLVSSTSTNSMSSTSTSDIQDCSHEFNLRPLKLSAKTTFPNAENIEGITYKTENGLNGEPMLSRGLTT